MRSIVLVLVGIVGVLGCEKQDGSPPPKAPHAAPKGGSQGAKAKPSEDAGSAQSQDEIVPPPDKPGYAPLP